MKKDRIAVAVLFVVVMCVAWGSWLFTRGDTAAEYNGYITAAQSYEKRNLYQKACMAYASALEVSESESVREKWLANYKKAYDDGTAGASSYERALQTTCQLYPQNIEHWKELLSMEIENEEYDAAYANAQTIASQNLKDDDLDKLRREIVYSFTNDYNTYSEIYGSPEGYFTCKSGDLWGIRDSAAGEVKDNIYEYIAPLGNSATTLYKNSKGYRLIDGSDIVQDILDVDIKSARAFDEDMLPLCGNDGRWFYYNSVSGEALKTKYDDASSYQNGAAYVKDKEGWTKIDAAGNKAGGTLFDDIKLYENGEYTAGGVMVASEKGKYGFYDAEGNKLSDFTCSDADVYMGSAIAFQDDSGKWGYATTDGNVVIKPEYDEAKSFSNGLAAVKDDDNWKLINTSNVVVIEDDFLGAGYFTSDGVCPVLTVGNNWYFIKRRFH